MAPEPSPVPEILEGSVSLTESEPDATEDTAQTVTPDVRYYIFPFSHMLIFRPEQTPNDTILSSIEDWAEETADIFPEVTVRIEKPTTVNVTSTAAADHVSLSEETAPDVLDDSVSYAESESMIIIADTRNSEISDVSVAFLLCTYIEAYIAPL